MAKLKIVQYKCGSVFVVSINIFNLLTCEYKKNYSVNTPKIRIELVSYISPSSRTG